MNGKFEVIENNFLEEINGGSKVGEVLTLACAVLAVVAIAPVVSVGVATAATAVGIVAAGAACGDVIYDWTH